MSMLRATDLARELGVSKGRISQYVSSGQLDGCYAGAGTARRFDLGKCLVALGRRLDPAQMLGNGAETKRRLAALEEEPTPAPEPELPQQPAGAGAWELSPRDPDRYELARTQKAEEEARRLRRQNLQDEGLYVLASEVTLQVGRLMGQEVAQVETVLREGARRIADELGVDYRSARQILVECWRSHRAARSAAVEAEAGAAGPSPAEREADL